MICLGVNLIEFILCGYHWASGIHRLMFWIKFQRFLTTTSSNSFSVPFLCLSVPLFLCQYTRYCHIGLRGSVHFFMFKNIFSYFLYTIISIALSQFFLFFIYVLRYCWAPLVNFHFNYAFQLHNFYLVTFYIFYLLIFSTWWDMSLMLSFRKDMLSFRKDMSF